MKLLMQGLCVVALLIVVVGLALHLSAGNLSTPDELAHDALATGLVTSVTSWPSSSRSSSGYMLASAATGAGLARSASSPSSRCSLAHSAR